MALRIAVLLVTLLLSAQAAAGMPRQSYLVLGVIASAEPGQGVVLLKSRGAAQAFAARVGQEIDAGVVIVRVTREYVYIRIDQRTERIRVGDEVDVQAAFPLTSLAGSGMERHGNRVKVATTLRDEILKRQLGKVMMQAAAVPYYENGALVGFRLWDIDAGSVFDRAGLADGDLITSLNGQPLTDVGRAVQMLHALRDEPRIEIAFVRKGLPQTLEIVVE